MRITVVANQKGGVGKTTTAMALASNMRKDEKRVLIIDADPQGNATDTYQAQSDGVATLYDVILAKEKTDIKDAIQHCELGDIVASDRLLHQADIILSADVDGLYRSVDALEPIKDLYDEVIIDTAPSVNMLLYNCLNAADEVVIPVLPDRYSIVGLSQLYEAIQMIKKRHNPKLTIKGIVIVKYKSFMLLDKAARNMMNEDAAAIGTILFNTPIRECVKCREAQACKKDLYDYAANCTTALDYTELYNEAYKANEIEPIQCAI